MTTTWNKNRYLMLPVQRGVRPCELLFSVGGVALPTRLFPLAENRVDDWVPVDRELFARKEDICLHVGEQGRMIGAILQREEPLKEARSPFPSLLSLENARLEQAGDTWRLALVCGLLGEGQAADRVVLRSRDLIWWEWSKTEYFTSASCLPGPYQSEDLWQGDIGRVVETPDKSISLAFLDLGRLPGAPQLSYPIERGEKGPIRPAEGCRGYRVFQLHRGQEETDSMVEPLALRVAPAVWPDIRLLPPEGTSGDIDAHRYEIRAAITLGPQTKLTIECMGHRITLEDGRISCRSYEIGAATTNGQIQLRLFVCEEWVQILGREQVLLASVEKEEKQGAGVSPVTANIAHCKVRERRVKELRMVAEQGAFSADITVYGLRSPWWSREAQKLLPEPPNPGPLLARGKRWAVYQNMVEDAHTGAPSAWVPDGKTVLSPPRVCEEFTWRDNPWGDMTRVINRTDLWRPGRIEHFPALETKATTLQAAYNIALDTFSLCADSRFSLPGEEGLWSSGLFQGEGQGFGVWARDSAHVAMRCGNLVDPATARATLLHTTRQGFDNGCDGPAMVVVGLWDYYLATGDKTALWEAWPALLKRSVEMEERFDEGLGLVRAAMSTSNDAFPEPENDGYSLGSETYYMLAYRALSQMGQLLGWEAAAVRLWENRALTMEKAVQELYWNEQAGFFTSGPKGSPAFDQGIWESAGMESALWSRFELADSRQRSRALQRLRKVALSDYGVVLFPHRPSENHFTGSVWGVWQAGFADAAATQGDVELIRQMLFGQVRSSVLHKTFYEVIDRDSGIAWRWPGQLWHAAGFLSLVLYGLFGIRYGPSGLHFSPAIPKELPGLRIRGLRYQQAVLDIELAGTGTSFAADLDGEPADKIPLGIAGKHSVVLRPRD